MDLSNSFWRLNQINVLHSLGADYGMTFGKCYAVGHKKSGEEATMKLVWKARMRTTEDGWRDVMNERLAWQRLSHHPYVLPLLGFFETEASYAFVTPNLQGACALSTVLRSAPLPDEAIRVMSAQLALAVNFAHENGFLLRNFSPDSVIVEQSGRMRLANFECAKEAEFSRRQLSERPFRAPEVIRKKCYGKEADWWAFGVMLFTMFSGTTPLHVYCLDKDIPVESDLSTEVLLRGKDVYSAPFRRSIEVSLLSPRLSLSRPFFGTRWHTLSRRAHPGTPRHQLRGPRAPTAGRLPRSREYIVSRRVSASTLCYFLAFPSRFPSLMLSFSIRFQMSGSASPGRLSIKYNAMPSIGD